MLNSLPLCFAFFPAWKPGPCTSLQCEVFIAFVDRYRLQSGAMKREPSWKKTLAMGATPHGLKKKSMATPSSLSFLAKPCMRVGRGPPSTNRQAPFGTGIRVEWTKWRMSFYGTARNERCGITSEWGMKWMKAVWRYPMVARSAELTEQFINGRTAIAALRLAQSFPII